MECAPGQIAADFLKAMVEVRATRVSLGVQSMVDAEAAATGRMHTRAIVEEDVRRLREAGLAVNVDLIAGLPGQTMASWTESVEAVCGLGVEHASLYMLEVDEDSRLGRELIGGGARYGAGLVATDDAVAAMYEAGCARLEQAGLRQYEISNFARPGAESRHNLRYWRREPYLGVGLDAHSMLRNREGRPVRFGNTDELSEYLAGSAEDEVELRGSRGGDWRRRGFSDLRLVEGVSLTALRAEFGDVAVAGFDDVVSETGEDGLLRREGDRVALTMRGRMLSNEVFAEFIGIPVFGVIARDDVVGFAVADAVICVSGGCGGFFDQAADVGFHRVAVAEADGGDADGAGAIDVIGHGQIVAAAVFGLGLPVAVEHGVVQAHLLREAGDLGDVLGVIAVDAENGESLRRVFLLESDEPWHLHAAGCAPGGPEVDEHGFAAEVGERDVMTCEVAQGKGGRGLVEKR